MRVFSLGTKCLTHLKSSCLEDKVFYEYSCLEFGAIVKMVLQLKLEQLEELTLYKDYIHGNLIPIISQVLKCKANRFR